MIVKFVQCFRHGSGVLRLRLHLVARVLAPKGSRSIENCRDKTQHQSGATLRESSKRRGR